MTRIATIGAYGFTEEAFFTALQAADVDVFYDIRWRRGVRGKEYAFVNAQRLQARLAALGIAYIHRRDLAPSPEIRQRQYQADRTAKIAKRQRSALSPDFVAIYQEQVLSRFNPLAFLTELPPGAKVIALFCVEREPAACHRSLLAERLCWGAGVEVEHLLPELPDQ